MRAFLFLVAIVGVACAPGKGRVVAELGVPADSTCAFVRVVAHPTPAPLVEEFIARDAKGEFTRASEWFNAATSCPGHEPAPDQATEIFGYQFRVLSQRPDSFAAQVDWVRAGYARAGKHESAPGVDIDTIVAVRTAFGWRVASPALNPHLPATQGGSVK